MNSGVVTAKLPDGKQSTNRYEPFPSRYARFGTFCLDIERQELFQSGTKVRMQAKVCEALLALLEKPGEVVTREALRARLWPEGTQINYDANVNTTVNKLRQVLGDSPEQPTFVETIPRKGYSFAGRVDYVERVDLALGNPARIKGNKIAFFGFDYSWKWLTVTMVALVIAGMLFGAAVVLYENRPI